MAISKLSSGVILIQFLLISTFFSCDKIRESQNETVANQQHEIEECRKSPYVALHYFNISFPEYDKEQGLDMKAIVLREGKIVKTFSQSDKTQRYISFEYDEIMKTDTIEIRLKKDVFYIHDFENNFWNKSKPRECYLEKYKINNAIISGIRENGFILKKKYL